jgi:hypothetical protein
MPRNIVSYRDPRWFSAFWQSFYRFVGTSLAMSTAFHPQTERASQLYDPGHAKELRQQAP